MLSPGNPLFLNQSNGAIKKPLAALGKLLTFGGLPYNMVNDYLAVMPYDGKTSLRTKCGYSWSVILMLQWG